MIYTFGYNNFSRQDLLEKATEFDAKIIDIRYNPSSFNVFWHKKELEKFFGQKYIHIRELGNTDYFGKTIKIADIRSGVEKILKFENCILVCQCQNFDKCHRKNISDYLLENHSIETIELLKP